MKRLISNILFGCINVLTPYIRKKFIKKLYKNAPANSKNNRPLKIFWGNTAIINIKYWSAAIKKADFESYTLVPEYYGNINKKGDYDLYFDDILKTYSSPKWLPKQVWELFKAKFYRYFVIDFLSKNASIYHIYYDGGPLGATEFWKDEIQILKQSGVKIVGAAYGGDLYMYSTIKDLSIRHVLNASYRETNKNEIERNVRVKYYEDNLDFIIGGYLTDGKGRWDILPSNPICFDLTTYHPKTIYSKSNGIDESVKICHLSNHRFYTGTEFILHAIEDLKAEGLKIDFFHPKERIKNDEVLSMLPEFDLFVDGIIFSGYGLAAIEAMSFGLPVIANLDNPELLQVFRRYSFLNESPVISATPETIKEVIRYLILNPEIRNELGKNSRRFVEKYHSEKAFATWFGAVIEKLTGTKTDSLMDYFSPVKSSSFNNSMPKIKTGLINNKLNITDAK